MSKGQFSSQIGFVVFAVMFIVAIGYGATWFKVDGVTCGDPTGTLSTPANSTALDSVLDTANDLTSTVFGCSSTNQLLNGFFTALKAGIILVFLMIIKDLVPFT